MRGSSATNSPGRILQGSRPDTVNHTGLALAFVLAAVAFLGARWAKMHFLGGGFDSSTIANVAWRLAHGFDSQTAMTGGHYLATHASPVMLPVVAIFRFSATAGMAAMFVAQAASILLAGWAGVLMSRHVGLSQRATLWLVGALFLSPTAWLATQFEFNETTLGVGPLAMTLALAIRGDSPRTTTLWAVLAASCRLELAATVVIAGIVIWSIGRRRHAVWILSASSPILLGYLVWLMAAPYPAVSIEAHFGHLGKSAIEVLGSAAANPLRALEPMLTPILLVSILFWLLPFGVVGPIVRLRWLSVLLPTTAVAVFGSWEPADAPIAHYWYGFIAIGVVMTPLAISDSKWFRERYRFLTGAGVVVGWVLMAPFLGAFRQSPVIGPDERELVRAVEDRPPTFVSAPGPLTSMLVDTPGLAPFPRPFSCATDALGPYLAPSGPPDVVIIPILWDQLDGEEGAALTQLLGAYEVVAATDQYVAWRVVDGARAASLYRPCSRSTTPSPK